MQMQLGEGGGGSDNASVPLLCLVSRMMDGWMNGWSISVILNMTTRGRARVDAAGSDSGRPMGEHSSFFMLHASFWSQRRGHKGHFG